jgi:hypothetical protein
MWGIRGDGIIPVGILSSMWRWLVPPSLLLGIPDSLGADLRYPDSHAGDLQGRSSDIAS